MKSLQKDFVKTVSGYQGVLLYLYYPFSFLYK